jgi:hypothetical protein
MKLLQAFAAVLFWASAGYADVTVTLSHDGFGGVIATIQGSGTTSGNWPGSEADFTDIGDYTDVETNAVLSEPILFSPSISIVSLDIDHDNQPRWPDDPDDFGLRFDLDVAPGTSFEIDGVSPLTGLSFNSLFPGTYSVLTDHVGVGQGTLIIESSPEEQIVILTIQIDDLVDSGILTGGQGNALNVKLYAAFKKLDQGKPDVAVNLLNAFINQVLSFIDDGVLTLDEGEALINAANSIIDGILGEEVSFSVTSTGWANYNEPSPPTSIVFSNLPIPADGVTLTITTLGDFDRSDAEWVDIILDNTVSLGRLWDGNDDNDLFEGSDQGEQCVAQTRVASLSASQIGSIFQDGTITAGFTFGSSTGWCPIQGTEPREFITLTISYETG